ncbi:MAG: carbohydrate kinase family protein, partial [Candidatus Kerfeldbacteria bacterium]|nr:carbohydrate kinase family protein [Candidatus Kerfeldbacteria bacterium]
LIERDREHRTALAVILMGMSCDRTILVYRGASENLRPNDIPWDRIRSPWLYVSSLGRSESMLRRVFRHAREQQCSVMWNPGSHELALGRSKLSSFLKQSTILVLNEEEARKLTGKLTASRESLLDALDVASPGMNVMTGGELGAWVSDHGKRFHAHGLSVKVVNTTGAGDAFSGGFLAGYIKTHNTEVAARVGILNSASVVQISGAKAGLLSKFPSQQQLRKVNITKV